MKSNYWNFPFLTQWSETQMLSALPSSTECCGYTSSSRLQKHWVLHLQGKVLWQKSRHRRIFESLQVCTHVPCAWWSSSGRARPCRSSSARRSWRTGPSSWCIRHCEGRRSGSTPHQSAGLAPHGTRESRTFLPRCWKITQVCDGTGGVTFFRVTIINLSGS